MQAAKRSLCVIGAGPSGMSVLYHLEKLRLQGGSAVAKMPQVACFEKQNDWSGLWNYTWRTVLYNRKCSIPIWFQPLQALTKYGETVHGSMYRSLWSNNPKETIEYPDYTFEQHFGRRWNQYNLKPKVTLLHSVQSVTFDPAKEKFSVLVKDLEQNRVLDPKEFDYVVNCSGHFSNPNVPYFKGIERFPGRVVHTHDLRSWREFTGKRVLVVGSSYSAEDSVLQSVKFGASRVISSYRTNPLGFRWPESVSERPLVTEVGPSDGGGTEGWARFADGSVEKIESIILATGYLHHYPYLAEQLRLRGPNLLYPAGLYKGIIWLAGGNNRLMYVGAQNQFYSFPMFDAQALWTVRYLTGGIQLPSSAEMDADTKPWLEREAALKSHQEAVDLQTDYTVGLAKQANYGFDLDASKLFYKWFDSRDEDITTYRDGQYVSKFTGKLAAPPATPFMSAMDDSLSTFLANGKDE
uniref:Flavin-containing monooxygenase n=1 Tax=Macrostomum lignano TaxID=282301 RepID=A0A1I8HMW8_9PLAT